MALPERFEGRIGRKEEGKPCAEDGRSVKNGIGDLKNLTQGDERKDT